MNSARLPDVVQDPRSCSGSEAIGKQTTHRAASTRCKQCRAEVGDAWEMHGWRVVLTCRPGAGHSTTSPEHPRAAGNRFEQRHKGSCRDFVILGYSYVRPCSETRLAVVRFSTFSSVWPIFTTSKCGHRIWSVWLHFAPYMGKWKQFSTFCQCSRWGTRPVQVGLSYLVCRKCTTQSKETWVIKDGYAQRK